MSANPQFELLDRGWEALDRGEPELALELAQAADESLAETWILRASAALDLDGLVEAEAALERARQLEGDDEDPELLFLQGEVALRRWRIDEAREKFERARQLAPSPAVLLKLALVADVEGDLGRADRYLRDAQRSDPANVSAPPRLSEAEFDDALQSAILKLPAPFREALASVAVIVDPMPTLAVTGDDPSATPPDILGLFTGASQLDQDSQAAELPPTIHLFQRNLERICADRSELEQQVEITLLHELGHYLGFDEDGVDDLGLG